MKGFPREEGNRGRLGRLRNDYYCWGNITLKKEQKVED